MSTSIDVNKKSKKAEPIAIIGIGCRFPGGANSPETFWEFIKNGVDAITEVPANRFDIDTIHDHMLDMPGKIVTRSGSFLEQGHKLDA